MPLIADMRKRYAIAAMPVRSSCKAEMLSRRHKMWGEYWAARGYLALHIDSFGPRGRAHGYGRNSQDLPERQAVNEMSVRSTPKPHWPI